ncbi:MAG: hypothetical protein RL122_1816 [Pseudomonadota bacterium]|jgi:hypothetical protein
MQNPIILKAVLCSAVLASTVAPTLATAGVEPFGESFDGWKFTQENVGQSILCRAVHNNQYVLGKQTNRRVHISFPNNTFNGTDTQASLAVGNDSEIITASGNGTRLILSNIPEAVFDTIGPERGFTWRAASKGNVQQGIVKLNDSTTSAIERLDECLDANSSKATATAVSSSQDWRKGAVGREVACSLKVKGKTYLNGTCRYDADKDGSFRLFGDKYFVYLTMLDKGLAGAAWNASPDSSHAQALLGEDFKRKGGCWIGKSAEICAWNKTEVKKPQTPSSTTPTRIKFAKGAISATVTGKLAGFESQQSYVIAVGKGQTMTVEQLNPANQRTTLGITAPNGADVSDMDLSCNNSKKVSPTIAGDYTIRVSECMKADAWKGGYKLKVTVK